MTQTDAFYRGLPDPNTQAEFYADVPMKRAIAWVVDAILIGVIAFLIAFLTLGIAFFFLGFVIMAVSFIYRSVSIANRSATPGMRLVAVELRNHRGEKLNLATAMLHTLGYQVSVAMVVPQIISIVLMLATPRAQGLSDHALGTVALNRSARA